MATQYIRYPSSTASVTTGDLTDAGTDGIVVTGGTGAVVGSGTSIAQHVADSTHNGYLSSTDWTTFNGKQSATLTSAHLFVGSAGNVATDTAVTGDVTISNAGVTAIGTNKVANAQLAQMAANSIKGNNTAGVANALDLTVAQTNTLLGTVTSLAAVGAVPNANGASIASNTLNLQPSDGSNPGVNTTAAQTYAGLKTFSTGIQLPTASGTPATLNYYEEGTFTANFNQNAGAGGTNTSYTVNFVRIGKMVTLVFPAVQPTAGATNAVFSTASSTVPATLRPTTASLFWMKVAKVNGVDSATPVQVGSSTAGVLSFQRDGAGATTFTNGSISGPYGFALNYTIQ